MDMASLDLGLKVAHHTHSLGKCVCVPPVTQAQRAHVSKCAFVPLTHLFDLYPFKGEC